MPAQDDGAAQIHTIRFAGNTLMGEEQLAPVVAGYLNRSLTYADLKAAAADVAAAYRHAGWIVRAYLPHQDVTEGVVTIQIIEAVFGSVKLESASSTRHSSPQILQLVSAHQAAGELLKAEAIDRVLLLIDDLPGVTVSGGLSAGQQERTSDLFIKVGEEPLVMGDLGLDNSGARSTGQERLSASFILNSPFQRGDLLSANAIHSNGSDYLRFAGTLPVGNYGWRVGLSVSQLRYQLTASEFTALMASGTSDTVGIEASYPLIRSRLRNLYINANLEQKLFDNRSNGHVTTRYSIDSLSLGLTGNLFDKLGGGGVNSTNLMWVSGQLNLDGSPNQAGDAVTTRSAGRYDKLRYAASRQQVISERVSLFAALTGQLASKNLDSAEKFYLGGMNGVRAYPSSEGGGTEGQLLNLELRLRLPEGFLLTGFYDTSRVLVNRNNQFNGAPPLNTYSLSGLGLSLAWQASNGLALKAIWARRIGDNPNPTANGNDQDGSLVKDRLWLSSSLPF